MVSFSSGFRFIKVTALMLSTFITVPSSLQILIIALVMLNWLCFSLFGEPGFSPFSLSFFNALMNESIYLFSATLCGMWNLNFPIKD